jgi:predicted flap endonuclease-1-like 5' DNA nuclease
MRIEKIEGIGPQFASKLQKFGIRTVTDLLKKGYSKKGRADIAQYTGLPEGIIVGWVNRADLMRIKGIGEEYSDLLEVAGVDSVKELRRRNPNNLYNSLVITNQERKLVRQIPSSKMVNKWIEQAKSLPPVNKQYFENQSIKRAYSSSLIMAGNASLPGDPGEDAPDSNGPDTINT